jgi:hypothetical protein
MSTVFKAKEEFSILKQQVPDAAILPFEEELMALVEAFANSGQSGASAPYTAGALSSAIKTLCLQEPLYPITCEEWEWMDVGSYYTGADTFQNRRLSSVFKEGKLGRPYYLNAIVFREQSGSTFTSSGSVTLKDGSIIGSANYIKDLPFRPKTFVIDVIEAEWADQSETVEQAGGGWWTSTVKDESQLDEVWELYDKKSYND